MQKDLDVVEMMKTINGVKHEPVHMPYVPTMDEDGKCCMCLPLGCGIRSSAVMMCIIDVSCVAVGIYQIIELDKLAGTMVLIAGLGFISSFFMSIGIICRDTKKTRKMYYKALVYFTVTFCYWNIVAVIMDNMVNIKLPEMAGGYPDSKVDEIYDKYGNGTEEARLEIEKLQAESLDQYNTNFVLGFPL